MHVIGGMSQESQKGEPVSQNWSHLDQAWAIEKDYNGLYPDGRL